MQCNHAHADASRSGYGARRWRETSQLVNGTPELPAANAVLDLPPTIDNAEIIEAVHARRALTAPVSASLRL
jgi:hypothetical protein